MFSFNQSSSSSQSKSNQTNQQTILFSSEKEVAVNVVIAASVDADDSMLAVKKEGNNGTNRLDLDYHKKFTDHFHETINTLSLAGLSINQDNNDKLFVRINATYLLLNTLRQDQFMDDANAKYHNTLSFMPAAQEIADTLGVKLDNILLADVFNGLADGEAYQKIMAALAGQYQGAHPKCPIYDKNKFLTAYLHMHRLAARHPNAIVIYKFSDDKTDILYSLYTFFSNHPECMPANVCLCLEHYAIGQSPEAEINPATYTQYQGSRGIIKGTGGIDYAAPHTIITIANIAKKNHLERDGLQLSKRGATSQFTIDDNEKGTIVIAIQTFMSEENGIQYQYRITQKNNETTAKAQWLNLKPLVNNASHDQAQKNNHLLALTHGQLPCDVLKQIIQKHAQLLPDFETITTAYCNNEDVTLDVLKNVSLDEIKNSREIDPNPVKPEMAHVDYVISLLQSCWPRMVPTAPTERPSGFGARVSQFFNSILQAPNASNNAIAVQQHELNIRWGGADYKGPGGLDRFHANMNLKK